jgi:hypothetical protein
MHLPKEDGDGDGKPEAVAPSAWVAALISGVLGNQLPGPGTLYLSQELAFPGRAHAGDTLTVTVRIEDKGPGARSSCRPASRGPRAPSAPAPSACWPPIMPSAWMPAASPA